MFNAIRTVYRGGSLLQPVVASKLMRRMQGDDSGQENPLTDREQEVLELLAQGLQNKEIATELTVTERTVKYHVSSILGKLDAGNRTEAVRLASQRGLIDLS